jgi:hypothetical protein
MEGSEGVSIEEQLPRRLPPNCVEDVDRHGNVRVYLRIRGQPKVRLRGVVWTPEFMAEYTAHRTATRGATGLSAIKQETWRWLCTKYFTSFQSPPTHYQTVLRQRLQAGQRLEVRRHATFRIR